MTRGRLLDRAVVVASVLIVVARRRRPGRRSPTGHVSSDAVVRPRGGAGLRRARADRAADRPPAARQPDRHALRRPRARRRRRPCWPTRYAVLVADPGSGSRPYDHVAAWFSNWAWVVPVSLLVCELPLRFPDGRLLSPPLALGGAPRPRPDRGAHARAGVRARQARQLSDRRTRSGSRRPAGCSSRSRRSAPSCCSVCVRAGRWSRSCCASAGLAALERQQLKMLAAGALGRDAGALLLGRGRPHRLRRQRRRRRRSPSPCACVVARGRARRCSATACTTSTA